MFGLLLSQSNHEVYENCRDAVFKCGNISAGFPFFGGLRVPDCGRRVSWIDNHFDMSLALNLNGVVADEEEELTRKLVTCSFQSFRPNALRFQWLGHSEKRERKMGKQKQEEDEDNRREAAIASTLSLQPNFRPVGVTSQQLSKFRELHRMRLQIKTKSNIHKKPEGRDKRFHVEYMNSADSQESDSNTKVEDESIPNPKSHSEDDNPFSVQDNEVVQLSTKKRQKLHWGLDTKERWERKANM